MKTLKPHVAQMDEIVFENRNKLYGAYMLRKMYNRQLTRAFILATILLAGGLVYPLISSFKNTMRGRALNDPVGIVFEPYSPPPAETPVPPPPPPSSAELVKRIRFVAPTVVEGEVVDNTISLNPDEFNTGDVNTPVDIAVIPENILKPGPIIVDVPEPPAIFVQEMPSYPGGDTERQKFLYDHIVYPQGASENGIEGTVYIQFVVDTKGNITDVKILRGIGGGCDEEALRVVKMMPQWNPGRQNGRNVRVLYNMAISFKLNN